MKMFALHYCPFCMVTFFHHCPPLKNLTIHVQIVSNSKALVSAHATFRIRTPSFPSARLDMILRTQASSPEPQSAQGVTCALLHANHFPSQSHSMSNRPHLIARITRNRPTSLALGLALLLTKPPTGLGVARRPSCSTTKKSHLNRNRTSAARKTNFCPRHSGVGEIKLPQSHYESHQSANRPSARCRPFTGFLHGPIKGFTLRGACRLHLTFSTPASAEYESTSLRVFSGRIWQRRLNAGAQLTCTVDIAILAIKCAVSQSSPYLGTRPCRAV